jgi:hypothetical protein
MVVSGRRYALVTIYPRGKDPQYTLDRRLGGPYNHLDQGCSTRRSPQHPKSIFICFWKIFFFGSSVNRFPSEPLEPLVNEPTHWVAFSHFTQLYSITVQQVTLFWTDLVGTVDVYLFSLVFILLVRCVFFSLVFILLVRCVCNNECC